MVYDLAAYERSSDECQLTVDKLDAALFNPTPALFGQVAEVDGDVAGFALWFRNFSTWDGAHGIYLEDLYVRPEYRREGLGRALLAELAAECVRNGYSRLQWWVLDWNAASIEFYRRLGARPMDEWTVFRLTGAALDDLATKAL